MGLPLKQKDYITQELKVLETDKMDKSFLLQQDVLPKDGEGESLPIDRLIKELDIPKAFLMADRLGLGKIEITYIYESTRRQQNNPIVYSFQIQCDFVPAGPSWKNP